MLGLQNRFFVGAGPYSFIISFLAVFFFMLLYVHTRFIVDFFFGFAFLFPFPFPFLKKETCTHFMVLSSDCYTALYFLYVFKTVYQDIPNSL